MPLEQLSSLINPHQQTTDSRQRDLAHELFAGNFKKSGSTVTQLSDPLVDTPMVITLDELKPYELNPRIIRNPMFDDIKASIRERGLDAPPAITRRPGESHYIIRNGGNTRLTILNELWKTTREERFFRIHCLFRPWQSEITVLTGHLAENELHGSLLFIERALGVEKIREFYEQEKNEPISQRQLSQRLSADGYPISQTLVSQMQETVHYLLPVIPDILYGGMSRRQVIQLLRLRNSAKDIWDKQASIKTDSGRQNFAEVFTDVLSIFNDSSKDFDFTAFQDQLTSHIAQIFECRYDIIAFELAEKNARKRLLESPPTPTQEIIEEDVLAKSKAQPIYDIDGMDEKEILSIPIPKTKGIPPISLSRTEVSMAKTNHAGTTSGLMDAQSSGDVPDSVDHGLVQHFIDEHIVSPVETTSRLNAIQDMVSELTGDTEPNFKTNVLKSIPVQAGGLYAISDIWHIGANLDNLESLRTHISQLVLEIVEELEAGISIQTTDDGLGFICNSMQSTDWTGQILIQFFQVLARQKPNCLPAAEELLPSFVCLLTGGFTQPATKRLSDVAFVKLMRVLRLMRRFNELNGSGQNNNHTLI